MGSDDDVDGDDSVSQFIREMMERENEMENEEQSLWEEAQRLAEMRSVVVAEEEEVSATASQREKRARKSTFAGTTGEADVSVIDATVGEWTWATWAIVVASFAYVIGWGVSLYLDVSDERTVRAAARTSG